MTDRYAVIGNPIAHSKSPRIHQMFAEQTGQDISYVAVESPLDGFLATVERLRSEGYRGCNVTIPFKQEACRCGALTARARDAQAANTLKFEADMTLCDNTDGIGLVNDIERNVKVGLRGKNILLIGAGGAAYGVLHPLLEASQASVVIYNRTLERADALRKSIEDSKRFPHLRVDVVEFGKLGNARFDVVINATSAGLTGGDIPLPDTCFAVGSLAYEMVYGRETRFLQFARTHGAAIVSDGLGMLVEQAAESFFLWRGIRPSTPPVISALRAS
jgi:shikimate dehydrogenase